MNEARKPDEHDPAASRPRLGELLVERGLISQERLDQAVAEGAATGLPLGTILVRDGLVPTHAVAMALADQQGAPLKTEHGFATGSHVVSGGDVVPLRLPPTSDGLAPPLSVPTVIGEPVVERIIENATLPMTPFVPAPPAQEPPAPLAQAPLVQAPLAQEPPAPVHVEPAVEPLVETPSLPVAPMPPLAHEPIAPLQVEPLLEPEPSYPAAEVEERFAALENVIDSLIDERNELRERLAALEDHIAAERAERSVAAERTYSSERHVLLAPNGERYELFERKGPAPEVGAVVELSGRGGFRVLRVGPAPFPGAFEACAYLDKEF